MSKAIKVVAAIEALKGTISLVAAVAAWSFAHTNLQTLITALAEHLHLNPAAKYPHIFVLALDNLHNTRMMTLALGAAAYTVLRFIEAFGLYRGVKGLRFLDGSEWPSVFETAHSPLSLRRQGWRSAARNSKYRDV